MKGMKILKDDNQINRISADLERLASLQLRIGIFGEDDSTLLMIGRVNEFGVEIEVTEKMRAFLHGQGLHLRATTNVIRIPERSYIRSTFDEQENAINNMAIRGVKNIILGNTTPDELMGRIGLFIVGLIQEKMVDLREPANHPYTVQKKGSSNPLIDTGHLRQSITYKVETV